MSVALFKRFRGYVAPALLTYTVLVTFLLVQTAWDEGGSVKQTATRSLNGPSGHRYVPSKEERRHLRRLEDVDGGYGNMGQGKLDRPMTNDDNNRRRKISGHQNGRRVQSSFTNDFYVDEVDANSTRSSNGSVKNDIPPPEGRDDSLLGNRIHQTGAGDVTSGSRIVSNGGEGGSVPEMMPRFRENGLPHRTNIEIEEMIPKNPNEQSSLSKNATKSALHFRHHSFGDKKSSKTANSSSAKADKSRQDTQAAGSTATGYCDNIEVGGKLCFRERVIFSHQKHVNISSTHQSFRGFAGLQIYSAFVDTRQTPAVIRIMIIGPKGLNNGRSNLWCAFSTALAVSRRYRWSGQEDSTATGQTQASQLQFYAASDGHDKSRQFYIMSCNVPDEHTNSLAKFDGNRIDIIAGTQDSPLLDTIQERVPITVINNKGLPWQVLKEQALAKARANVPNNSPEQSIRTNIGGQALLNSASRTNSDSEIPNNWIGKGSLIAQNINQTARKYIFGVNSLVADSNHVSNNLRQQRNESSTFVLPSGGRDAIVSCVAPVHNLVSLLQITEFIELTLLLGIQHIVIYTPRVSADVRDILELYSDQGLVTVMPWNIKDSTEIWAKGRDIALNDCLYRTMFRFDFVLFHDMDEFLIPKATPDLPSLMTFLRTKGKLNTTRISDIVFNSAYFSPPTKAQTANLTTMPGYTKDVPKFLSLRSLHRTYFSSLHTIRIIKPVSAMRVGPGERKRTTFYINPRFAAMNHYAKCPNAPAVVQAGAASGKNGGVHGADKNDPSKNVQNGADCVHTKWDDSVWRYRDKLIQYTKNSIHVFNARGKEASRG